MQLFFLVVFLLLVHNLQAQFFSSSKSTDESVLKLEANAEKVLDSAEHVLNRAWKWTSKHRQLVKGVSGALILGYGGNFANTLLLAKAVSVSGMPIIVKSFQEMQETYTKTRAALKEDLPAILSAKSKVAHLEARLDVLTMKMKEDNSEAETMKIETEIASIRTDLSKIAAVSDHVQHFVAAVDPSHLKIIAGQIYISLLAGAAAVSSQTAQAVTLGMNIAKVFSGMFQKLFGVLKEKTRTNESILALEHLADQNKAWATAAFTAVTHGCSILFAGMLRQYAMITSTCALGSHMLLEAMEDLIDPILEKFELPTLKANPSAAAAIQTSAVVIGVASQLRGGIRAMPWLVKFTLSPILLMELLLKKTLLK